MGGREGLESHAIVVRGEKLRLFSIGFFGFLVFGVFFFLFFFFFWGVFFEISF